MKNVILGGAMGGGGVNMVPLWLKRVLKDYLGNILVLTFYSLKNIEETFEC